MRSNALLRKTPEARRRKRLAAAIAASLCALALLLALALTLAHVNADSSSDSSSDLRDFVTGITIRDGGNNVVYPAPPGSGVVNTEESYFFQITFSERYQPGDYLQYKYEDGVLTYQLPDNIVVRYGVSNKLFLDASNNPMGIYSVDLSGLITVYLEYVDIDDYENIALTLYLEAEFNEGGKAVDFDFGNDVVVTLDVVEPPAGLNVRKTATAFNPGDETIDYSITIRAVNGDISDITAQDQTAHWVGASLRWLFEDSDFGASQMFRDIAWTTTDASWGTTSGAYSGAPWHQGDQLLFDFTGKTLHKDESITITYTFYMEDVMAALRADPRYSSVNWANYTTTTMGEIRNTVLAEGTAPGGEATEPVTAETKTPLERTLVTKSSSLSTTTEDTVNWTTTWVGDGFTVLNGGIVTDTLGRAGGLQSGDITFLPIGLRIFTQPADADGVLDANAYTFVTEAQAVAAGWLVFNAERTSFTLTIPEATAFWPGTSTPIGDIYRVRFVDSTNTYGMLTTASTTDVTYTNSLGLELPGGPSPFTFNRTQYVPPGMKIDKSYIATPEGIEYTATITIPAGSQGKNLGLYDYAYVGSASANSVYFVDRDFLLDNMKVKVEINEILAGEPAFLYTVRNAGSRSNAFNAARFQILFGRDDLFGTGTATGTGANPNGVAGSIWPYNTEKTLTITYTFPWDLEVFNGMTIREYLEAYPGQNLMNVMYWQDYSNGSAQGYSSVATAWPVRKTAARSPSANATVDYTVYLNPVNALFTQGEEALFIDEFDGDMLEYVPKSFYVTYVNTSNVRRIIGPYTGTGAIGGPGVVEDIYDPVTNPGGAIKIEDGKITVDFSKTSMLYYHTFVGTWNGDLASAVKGTSAGGWYYLAGSAYTFEVHYQLRLKDPDYVGDDGTVTLDNKASIVARGKTARRFMTGQFDDDCEAVYGTPIVDKNMQSSGNVTAASIIINPEGKTLNMAPNPTGRIGAVDQMKNTLSFYLGTIQVWELKPGKTWADALSADPSVWQLLDGAEWSYTVSELTEEYTELSFDLPDSKALKITYSARLKGDLGDTVHVENWIQVQGKFEDDYEGWFEVERDSMGGGFGEATLELHKHDSSDMSVPLEGAVFALYRDMVSMPVTPPAGVAPTITAGGSTYYYIASGATDGSGKLTFASQYILYDYGGVFALVELEAPENYLLPDNGDEITLFSFSAGQGVPLIETDFLTVGNTPESCSLQISKTVADISDSAAFAFTVKDSAGNPVDLTVSSLTLTPGGTGIFGPTDLANGTFTLTHGATVLIEGLPPGTYQVTEDAPGYTITFAADGGAESAPAPDTATAGTGEISIDETCLLAFTNLYIQPGIPFTFLKTDRNFAPLDGVKFALFSCGFSGGGEHEHSLMVSGDAGCCWVELENGTAASDNVGRVVFEDLLLPTGVYMLVETETKPGFQLPFGQWRIQVDADALEGEQFTIIGVSDSNSPPPAFHINGEGELTVVNYPRFTLPRSGVRAYSLLLFSAGGAVLLGIAGFLGVGWARHRKRSKATG